MLMCFHVNAKRVAKRCYPSGSRIYHLKVIKCDLYLKFFVRCPQKVWDLTAVESQSGKARCRSEKSVK